MKQKTSRILCIIVVLSMLLPGVAQAAKLGNKDISAAGACLLDYNTGEILFSHNGDIPRVPASMTKIMTAYCVYDAIENGEISLDTIVPISNRVYNMARNPEYQCVPLEYNANYTVDELLGVLITYSPIAPAVALAEVVAGDEAAFVERMNEKVRSLGIAAYFYDASGLARNEITPVAMAQLTKSIIETHPDILERTKLRYVTFRGRKYYSTNKLYTSYRYPGADGMKTGTTSASGYCFCGTAVRDSQRYIAVSMGAASATQRFVDVTNMLDYGFSLKSDRLYTLRHTDISAFVDGAEIPVFTHGITGKTVVFAEDLANYGFDISYDHETKTLTVLRNENKAFSPIPMDYYRNKNDELAYKIVTNTVTVVFSDGDRDFSPKSLYNVNGFIGIETDELSAFYGVTTDNGQKTVNIFTKNVSAELQ